MKKNIAILILAAAAVLLAVGCELFPVIEGSGFPRTESFAVPGFTRVAAESTFKVQIIPDAAYSVSVTCDDNLVPYLVVDRSGDMLTLGLKPGYTYRQVILAAEVHMPSLAAASASGASELRVQAGFTGSPALAITASGASTVECAAISSGNFTTDVSGASTVTVQSLATGSFAATVSGASTLTATGSAVTETLSVSGASRADLRSLAGTQASVNMSGASKTFINVGGGRITLTVSGASTLYHTGSPVFVINELSGGSSIMPL
jgi:hypothetical protein